MLLGDCLGPKGLGFAANKCSTIEKLFIKRYL
ncbi:MAG: hypothetical protein ACI9RV_000683 [Glaciecola sp.]